MLAEESVPEERRMETSSAGGGCLGFLEGGLQEAVEDIWAFRGGELYSVGFNFVGLVTTTYKSKLARPVGKRKGGKRGGSSPESK